MAAYYNDNDPKVAAWLRELIAAGAIAPGDVDERDVRDVRPSELAGYTQCHFFAGIGVWSYALRLAGWPDDRAVWTASLPCQPFSQAGSGSGFADERHLWPAYFHLVRQRRPVRIFGEQVASDDGLAWLDVVRPDLESEAYAVGCADLCAAGFGAPHIRQRLFFVADALRDRTRQHARKLSSDEAEHEIGTAHRDHSPITRSAVSSVAEPDAERLRLERAARLHDQGQSRDDTDGRCAPRVVVDAAEPRSPLGVDDQVARRIVGDERRTARVSGVTRGFWSDAEWIRCTDDRWRPVRPGSFPLAHGAPARVVRLRGYGNAINAEAAAAFIRAYSET